MNDAEKSNEIIYRNVNLVDILVFLIRKRVIWIGTALLALAVAVGIQIVAPARVPEYKVSIRLMVAQPPEPLKSQIGINLMQHAQLVCESPTIIAGPYWDAGLYIGGITSRNDPAYEDYIVNNLIGKDYIAKIESSETIILSLSTKDPIKAKGFMSGVIKTLDDSLGSLLADRASVILAAIERIKQESKNGSDKEISDTMKQSEYLARFYSDNAISIVSSYPQPVVEIPGPSWKRPLAIAFFGGLLFGLILSFISDVWDGIVKNPQDLAKIKAALGKRRSDEK